jgi:hypothetical protein
MQQPRAKLVKDKKSFRFPVTVNGKFVDPSNPRPWQADKGAYNPWTGYFWTGKSTYDRQTDRHLVCTFDSINLCARFSAAG